MKSAECDETNIYAWLNISEILYDNEQIIINLNGKENI